MMCFAAALPYKVSLIKLDVAQHHSFSCSCRLICFVECTVVLCLQIELSFAVIVSMMNLENRLGLSFSLICIKAQKLFLK